MRYEGKSESGPLVDETGVDLQRAASLLRQTADVTILSYPKSGRTWLSYMTSAFIARYLGRPHLAQHIVEGRLRTLVPEKALGYVQGVLEVRTHARWAPLILFDHRIKFTRPYTDQRRLRPPSTKVNFLLVRDPRDATVSFYYHIFKLYRGKIPGAGGRRLPHMTLGEFIRSDLVGINQAVSYLAHWGEWADKTDTLVIYYEDMLDNPEAILGKVLTNCGIGDVDVALVTSVVADTSFERLKNAEIVSMNGEDDPSRRRMRRGEAGGFREETADSDRAYMADAMRSNDSAILGRYLVETE